MMRVLSVIYLTSDNDIMWWISRYIDSCERRVQISTCFPFVYVCSPRSGKSREGLSQENGREEGSVLSLEWGKSESEKRNGNIREKEEEEEEESKGERRKRERFAFSESR